LENNIKNSVCYIITNKKRPNKNEMMHRFNMVCKKINSIFRIRPLIIKVIDNITYANTKDDMFTELFALHMKYFEMVDFDHLFFDILDTVFNIEIDDSHCSYLDIAYEIIRDDEINKRSLLVIKVPTTQPAFQKK
jgi:hypothetical protein